MGRSKSSKAEFVLHERYDPSHPLLRELVLVHVYVDRGRSFDTLLTRVPGIDEEINREAKSYRVVRVQHEPADRWMHVVGVYSAPRRIMKLYVDGKEAVSETNGRFPRIIKTTASLRIGVRGLAGPRRPPSETVGWAEWFTAGSPVRPSF